MIRHRIGFMWDRQWRLFTICVVLCVSISAAEPIRSARTSAPGSTVSIEGYVTVPSNIFRSATGESGFAIQEGADGIYVTRATDDGLSIGTRVRATGELADDGHGLLTLRATSVVPLTGRKSIGSMPRKTGAIGESSE